MFSCHNFWILFNIWIPVPNFHSLLSHFSCSSLPTRQRDWKLDLYFVQEEVSLRLGLIYSCWQEYIRTCYNCFCNFLYFVGIPVSGRQTCNSGVTALIARISPALTALVHFALLLLYVEIIQGWHEFLKLIDFRHTCYFCCDLFRKSTTAAFAFFELFRRSNFDFVSQTSLTKMVF